jgi:hypothetical protein
MSLATLPALERLADRVTPALFVGLALLAAAAMAVVGA